MSDRPYLTADQRNLQTEIKIAEAEVAAGGTSAGILWLGDSGSGKGHGLDAVTADPKYEPFLDGTQRIVPCVRVEVPSDGSVVTLCMLIMAALEWGGTVRSQGHGEMLLRKALKQCRVVLLILEEFNNALLVSSKIRASFAEFLKSLWNLPPKGHKQWVRTTHEEELRLVVVASGTPNVLPVLNAKRYRELRSRFNVTCMARPLWFSDTDLFNQFRHVVREKATEHGLADILLPRDTDMISRLLIACDSHLRDLNSLLRRASFLRKNNPSAPLTELLSDAFVKVIGPRCPIEGNPFLISPADLTKIVQAAKLNPKS
jgi:hypothetical protein